MTEQISSPLDIFHTELNKLKSSVGSSKDHPIRNLSAKTADPSLSQHYRQMAAVVRTGTAAEVLPGVCLALMAVKMDDIPINPIYGKVTALITHTEVLAKIDEFLRSTPKQLNAKYGKDLTIKA